MSSPRRLFWPSLLGLVIVIGLTLGSLSGLLAGPTLQTIRKGSFTPLTTPPSSAQQVQVGFYPIAVYDLDLASNTFYADSYVWMRWTGDIDPTASIEFTNMVEEWGKLQEPLLEKPKTLPDGSKYQLLRVEGRFAQPFSLIDYPLDHHNLTIQVEDTTHGINEIAYVIDQKSSGISNNLQIPGWKLSGWEGQTFEHAYGTNFGEMEQASNYSVASFTMAINRPISFFLWKLLLPLVIVVLAALVALLVNPEAIDARLALPLGSLLSAIFLQKSYVDTLPDLGYLVFMDKIYLLAYPLILLVLIRAIQAYMKSHKLSESEAKEMQRIDRQVMIILGISFLAGTGLITLLH